MSNWTVKKEHKAICISLLHHTCKDGEAVFQTSGSSVMAVNPAQILIYSYLHIGYSMDTGSTISPLALSLQYIFAKKKNPKPQNIYYSSFIVCTVKIFMIKCFYKALWTSWGKLLSLKRGPESIQVRVLADLWCCDNSNCTSISSKQMSLIRALSTLYHLVSWHILSWQQLFISAWLTAVAH